MKTIKNEKKESWGSSSMLMYDMQTNERLAPITSREPYLGQKSQDSKEIKP